MKKTSEIKFTDLIKSGKSDSPVFWSWVWNGELSRDGIMQELDDFAKAGIGGLYIIPEPREFRPNSLRTYLDPPYMSDEFLALYHFALGYALSKNIRLWLYDEGGWPSGGACGLTKKALNDSDPMQLCKNTLSPDGKYIPSTGVIAAFDENGRRIAPGSEVSGKVTEFTAARHYCGVNLVDSSDKKVTEAFISTTHEKFYREFPELFGKNIDFMFTDEPKLVENAWNDSIPERFRREFGYDLLDHLPELEKPLTEAGRRALIDYKKLLGILFDENFISPCADWCHEHGIGLCGHLDQDNILNGSIAGQYGSGLKLLRQFDLPGVDVIWQQIFPGKQVDGLSFFPRFASSAARQSGSERALSESFAVYGDSLTSEQMRYVINYQLWQGINVFNFMTLPYGRKKALTVNMRPMPCPEKPGFFSMEHIYKSTALLSDLMSTGKRICDTALYLPAADISLGGEIAKRAMASVTELGEELSARLIDFDLIDDEALRNAAKTPDGLRIGRAFYKHVVIPECQYMPCDVREIAEKYPGRGKPLAKCDHPDIRVAARESDGEKLYFVFNKGAETADLRLEIDDFPESRLEIETGRLLKASGHMTLRSGEAALLISGAVPEESTEQAIGLLELTEADIVSIKRFILSAEGVSCETIRELPEDLTGFSGEIGYRVKLPDEERLMLSLELPGFRAAVYDGENKLGDCGGDGKILLNAPPSEVTIVISNDASVEVHAKMQTLSKLWDSAEYAFYNQKLMENESPARLSRGMRIAIKLSRL